MSVPALPLPDGQDPSPGRGSGFGSGGCWDSAQPGPLLAGAAAGVWQRGLGQLPDDHLVGVLAAARRMASWSAAMELAAAGELDARRCRAAQASGDPRAGEHVEDEISAVLTLTRMAASRVLELATAMARLPATAAALRTGSIDLPRAAVIADELHALSDAGAAAVDLGLADRAGGLTTGQLRVVARRHVLAVDPDAARKRREKAEKQARVEVWAEPAGTSALAGRDLPPAFALAADRHISALARALRAAGAPGTLDQLRAKVFTALLSGYPVSSLLPGPASGSPVNHGPAHGSPADAIAGSGPGSDRLTSGGSVNGERGDGGSSDGGPDAGSSDGEPDGDGSHGPLSGRGMLPPLTGTVNLTIPLDTWLGLAGHPGNIPGAGPIDAAASRDLAAVLAADARTRWCLTITTGSRAAGHGCAGPGPAPPPGAADQSQTWAWLARIKIDWLETGSCSHQRECAGYRPSVSLRHLIKVRDLTCSYLTCRRPAEHCDDDHTKPYQKAGRTCECNLAPLCRWHHQAKQTQNWRLDQPEPGVLVWTLPHGRQYPVRPDRNLR